jgi:hypothetical protein
MKFYSVKVPGPQNITATPRSNSNEEAGNEHLLIPGRLMIKQPCAPSR